MVTISCAFRYSVSGRSTGTLISTAAPVWSVPATRSVSRGSSGIRHDQGDGGFVDLHHGSQASMTFPVADIKHLGVTKCGQAVIASEAKQSTAR